MKHYVMKAFNLVAIVFVVFLLFLLFSINILSLKNQNAQASSENLVGIDGTSVNAGSKANPFKLSAKEDLYILSAKVKEGNVSYISAYYQLECDIVVNDTIFDEFGNVAADTILFEPIGTLANKFSGHFNGNGHTIKGLYVNVNYAALFGYTINANIYNLGIIDSFFQTAEWAASVVANGENTKIINCYNTGRVQAKNAGGIAGTIKNSIIINCYNIGSVEHTRYGGGVACYIQGTTSKVESNYYLKIDSQINSTIFYAAVNSKIVISDEGSKCASFSSGNSIISDNKNLLTLLNDNIEELAPYNLELVTWATQGEYPTFEKPQNQAYTVTYDSAFNGGKEATVIMNVDTQESVDLGIIATKDEYQFLGWNTNCNANIGMDALIVENENIVLYAIFSKEISIDFIDNEMISQKVTLYNNETSYNVAFPDIDNKEDWIAAGWRNDTLPSDKQYEISQIIQVFEDSQFYAVYNKQIIIEFETNSDTILESQNATLYNNAFGTESSYTFNLPSPIQKTGYDFYKWQLGEKYYDANQEIIVTSSATIIATYNVKENVRYTICHNTQSLEGIYICQLTETKTGIAYEKTAASFVSFDGFTVEAFEQATIYPDETTVVNINYTRNSYEVIYKTPNNENYYAKELKYQQEINHDNIEIPTQLGYMFVGWDCGYLRMPSNDITVLAKWEVKEVKFTVRELKEKIEFENLEDMFEIYPFTCTGYTDSITEIEPKIIDGFTADEIIQKIINADGSTVVDIYYYRNSFDIVYKTHDNENHHIEKLKYQQEINHNDIQIPTRLGYVFVGWDCDYLKMPSSNITVLAKWKASKVSYKIRELKEKIDFENLEDRFEINTVTCTGYTDSYTEIVPKIIDGFTAQGLIQKIINADGSTVVDIYYYRNSYNIFYMASEDDQNLEAQEVRFGETITRETHKDIPPPVREGYIFRDWQCEYSTMPSTDIIVGAIWIAKNVNYTLLLTTESLDGGYKSTRFPQIGLSGDMTNEVPQILDGFTALPVEQQIIKGDGTTIVELKYKRNSYNLRYLIGENVLKTYNIKYQDKINDIPETPIKLGYTFSTWQNLPELMPSYDVDVKANFKLNLPIITPITQPLEKTYDGKKMYISFDVSHDLDNIIYTWYKGNEKISENKVLELENVNDTGMYYLQVKVCDGLENAVAVSENINVVIKKAKIDIGQITFEDKDVYYDGKIHEITIAGNINPQVTVTYTGNSGVEIGKYIAKASFDAGNNYEEIEDMEAVLNILAEVKEDEGKDPSQDKDNENSQEGDKKNSDEENPWQNEDQENSPEYESQNSVVVTSEELSKETLNLKIANCTINMNKQSFDTLKSKANLCKVQISLNKVEKESLQIEASKLPLLQNSEIYNLSLLIGENCVDFDAEVEISIPYTLKENENTEDIRVWNMQNNTLKLVNKTTYKDGFVSFISECFSFFVIGTHKDDIANIEDETLIIIGTMSTVCLIIISAVVIRNTKKRKKAK